MENTCDSNMTEYTINSFYSEQYINQYLYFFIFFFVILCLGFHINEFLLNYGGLIFFSLCLIDLFFDYILCFYLEITDNFPEFGCTPFEFVDSD